MTDITKPLLDDAQTQGVQGAEKDKDAPKIAVHSLTKRPSGIERTRLQAMNSESSPVKRDLALHVKIVKDQSENDEDYLERSEKEGQENLTIPETFARIAKESFPIITSSIFF